MKTFIYGVRSMLPILTAVIPFGAVMGTVCAEAKLNVFQTVFMNVLIFAGASQLAAIELMTKDTASLVVITTGVIINLRFLLYSAAMSPVVQHSRLLTKMASAYALTDQNYAVMSAHKHRLHTREETIIFYFGASSVMLLGWHSSVIAGYAFGNFAPASWALDYAVPLSFVALVVPTLKNLKYVLVAFFSGTCALALNIMPYRLGLIASALLAIGLAAVLTRKSRAL